MWCISATLLLLVITLCGAEKGVKGCARSLIRVENMKAQRITLAAVFLFGFAELALSQDVILKKDNTTILSKVLEINNSEIKYKKWSNQEGPTYSISRTEVAKINYENGEVESFSNSTSNQQNKVTPKIQYLNSYMTSSCGRLYLNGRLLSDYEIKSLIDAESYLSYQKGRRQIKTGVILDIIGGATLLVELLVTPKTKTTLVIGALGAATLGSGILFGAFGSDKTNEVVKTYNKNHGNAYSLNISPSLMRCKTLQSQDNYGLGLTFSMNF